MTTILILLVGLVGSLAVVETPRLPSEERWIPWTLWEWKAGFGYWDPVKEQPVFRSSLFE